MFSETITHSLIEQIVLDNQADIDGIALVNGEGMLLDSYVPTTINPEHTAIISSTLLNFVNRIGKTLEIGLTSEIMLRSDAGYVAVFPVSASVTIVALLVADANLGIVRHELRELSQRLKEL